MLLGAAFLFWGWQTGLWLFAIPVALALEAAHLIESRLEFTEKELNRLWDVSTFLFLGGALYAYNAGEKGTITFMFFQWMPLLLLLMPLAELYSVKGMIPVRTFSWFLRKHRAPEGITSETSMPIGYIYFTLILIAASAANKRDSWFYPVLTLLCAWAFWCERPKRFPAWKWGFVFFAAAVLGNCLHTQVHQLHTYLELRSADLWNRWWRRSFDPLESQTSIGSIRGSKQSSRIVLRLRAIQGSIPVHLRAASYNNLSQNTWYTDRKKFDMVSAESDLTTWFLGPQGSNTLGLGLYLNRGKGLLPLPVGVTGLSGLPVGTVETNIFGALRVSEGPGLLNCRVHYGDGPILDTPPDERDVVVPERDQRAITAVVVGLNLDPLSPAERLAAIEKHFLDGFSYTLEPDRKAAEIDSHGGSPIAHFLNESKAGHCELYATATTLMLRKAGIPARYATGYAVDAGGEPGQTFVVREKDAHAWVLAFVGGAWREVDTTPGNWRELEQRENSFSQRLKDLFSDLWYRFSTWRWNREKSWVAKSIPFVLVAILIGIVGRTFLSKRNGRSKLRKLDPSQPGGDSPFYMLEDLFARRGRIRGGHETMAKWGSRLKEHEKVPADFQQALELHYRYRFDPAGLDPAEVEQLNRSVSTTSDQIKASRSP